MLVYGMITKGNGDVILSPERHTSLSTGGGQAGQGYPCVLEPIYAVDMGGGKPSSVFYENISPTLCTTHYGEPVVTEPIVYSFIPRESSKTRSIGFAEEVAPTLNADNNCAVVTEDAESNRNA